MKPSITVIGSINMDLVTSTEQFPHQGETVMGASFLTVPGGKGANQAVAAARLGATVQMIGCVGEDSFGKDLQAHLENEGILTTNVKPVTEQSTGIATIVLSEGDNRIIVVPGANYEVTPEMVQANEAVIANSDLLMLQLEIPVAAVKEAITLAKKHHVPVLLNPAPIQKLPEELLQEVTYLTPNEHELEVLLASMSDSGKTALMEKLIVTQGAAGIVYYENGSERAVPGYRVQALDTTGAGDTFNGAFAVAISKGMSIAEACQFGNAAAALSVTKLGAQSGMPTEQEVNSFLQKQKG